MTPSHERVFVSRQEVCMLEDLTHDLCNLMTVLLYQISLLPSNQQAPEFERVMNITRVVERTEHTLKMLLGMWGDIQEHSAAKHASA